MQIGSLFLLLYRYDKEWKVNAVDCLLFTLYKVYFVES